jgi:hypothetical protein
MLGRLDGRIEAFGQLDPSNSLGQHNVASENLAETWILGQVSPTLSDLLGGPKFGHHLLDGITFALGHDCGNTDAIWNGANHDSAVRTVFEKPVERVNGPGRGVDGVEREEWLAEDLVVGKLAARHNADLRE